MTENEKQDINGLIAAMDGCWRDHQNTRAQTWGALTIVVSLAGGAIALDSKFGQIWSTAFSVLLVVVAAIIGIRLTWHHREYERRKFFHIMKCEEALGLRKLDEKGNSIGGLLHWPVKPEKQLRDLTWSDLLPWAKDPKTPSFIIQMHLAVIVLSILLAISRLWYGSDQVHQQQSQRESPSAVVQTKPAP